MLTSTLLAAAQRKDKQKFLITTTPNRRIVDLLKGYKIHITYLRSVTFYVQAIRCNLQDLTNNMF